MYTVHSRSHYTGLLWSVVRADYSNNTPLTHTCMERETGTVVGGAAGQRRDEVTERSMAGPSLESSPVLIIQFGSETKKIHTKTYFDNTSITRRDFRFQRFLQGLDFDLNLFCLWTNFTR